MSTKRNLIPKEAMRPEDRAIERIPWKDMEIGGIYQRKDGRYYIYAGRAVVYHTTKATSTRESDKYFYTYIYIDGPGVLCKPLDEETLSIICSSAKIRSSEYRDIARTKVGQLEGFSSQFHWCFSDFTVVTDSHYKSVGSTKRKVTYSRRDKEILKNYMSKKATKGHASKSSKKDLTQ